MSKKEFVVFGLGRFGRSVAVTLAESGCEVLVVDDTQEKIQEMADIVTYAVKADVTDSETMESLGISNFDGAVVAIGQNLEASVMVTILAKELGIPYVLAKAQNELHAKILKKVGADAVVFPEKETGVRIAHNLVMGNFFNAVELSSTFSLMEIDALEEWDGHNLMELNIRAKYKINVIGVKKGNTLDINPSAEKVISKNDTLVVIGENEVLNRFKSKMEK
ncbi:potassium channel family protein [Anaeromicropila populeti]|uniref:Trk system potassium uptake protein TrkA n=1 Tax=Anaeromicropila populeti TaxID=37658 RepID=A0A1I6JZG9_9FIRM|nr:TrkA family potassium uptake protein [Anaeromicropila populeti]SFR84382.1 trk system potassium uptake protein TrkA [Anaeromicropila populeti]